MSKIDDQSIDKPAALRQTNQYSDTTNAPRSNKKTSVSSIDFRSFFISRLLLLLLWRVWIDTIEHVKCHLETHFERRQEEMSERANEQFDRRQTEIDDEKWSFWNAKTIDDRYRNPWQVIVSQRRQKKRNKLSPKTNKDLSISCCSFDVGLISFQFPFERQKWFHFFHFRRRRRHRFAIDIIFIALFIHIIIFSFIHFSLFHSLFLYFSE